MPNYKEHQDVNTAKRKPEYNSGISMIQEEQYMSTKELMDRLKSEPSYQTRIKAATSKNKDRNYNQDVILKAYYQEEEIIHAEQHLKAEYKEAKKAIKKKKEKDIGKKYLDKYLNDEYNDE